MDVWIDTDAAIGVPGADVDDGLALIQAFNSPELRVRGVSSVYGNAPIEKTHPIATALVKRFGPARLGVQRGAPSAKELGATSEAVSALAAGLRERRLTILAIGPLTNVASLMRLYPERVSRIDQIVCVAARRPDQHFLSVPSQPSPFPDLNFDCDPTAMQVLLDSGAPLVFAPWEVSSHVWITADDLDSLGRGGESGAFLASTCRDWLAMWERDLGAPGFNPFDSLAVGWATHPNLLHHFRARVWIEAGLDDTASEAERQQGATKAHLLVEPVAGDSLGRATYCTHPAPEFKALLLERLAGRQAAANVTAG